MTRRRARHVGHYGSMRPRRRSTRLVVLASVLFTALASGAGAVTLTGGTTVASADVTGIELTCPNENIVLAGRETVLAINTSAPSGIHTIHLVFNLRGVTATGVTSGTAYSVTGVSVSGSTFSIGPLATASTSTFVQTWLLVSRTGGEPLSFHEVLTVIYDANGSLAASVARGPSDCD